jgi:hypothetical protein
MKTPSIPADLATLAWAEPGQELEVRRTLPGAGALGELLTPGSRVRCSEVDGDFVVLEAVGDLKLRIPMERARLVQVERTLVGGPAR